MHEPSLGRRVAAEFMGTALLVTAVVGSGIAAQHLSLSDVGLELLENAFATSAALVAIILAVGPVSGAHLNPAVTLADWALRGMGGRAAVSYPVGPGDRRSRRHGAGQRDVYPDSASTADLVVVQREDIPGEQ